MSERPRALARRGLVVALGVLALFAAGFGGFARPVTGHASPLKFYFHGGNADDANRAGGTPTATFDAIAPSGTTPSTQTSVQGLTPNACGSTNIAYWTGTAFTGSINGTVHLDLWYQTTNAEAVAIGSPTDFTVCGDGVEIGHLDQAVVNFGPTPTENTFDIPAVGTVVTTLVIQAAPHFTDAGQGNTVLYNATAEPSFFTVSSGPPPTPTATATATPGNGSGMTGPQSFDNYQAPYPYPHNPPPPTVVALLFGEPSIGVDWGTNNTMYQGDLNTWQVQFNYAVKPPTATWNDRSHVTTDNTSLDARLITDHAGLSKDRTIVEQLATGNSAQAFTDTDGGTAAPPANSADWVASIGGGFASLPDHESIGAGRYTVTPPMGAGVVYPHAIYYCSQGQVLTTQPGPIAFCSRSDDGGATYGTPAQLYTDTQCGGLHGKPRVGPDGVVYLPNKDCSGAGGVNAAKAVVISKDNGGTWAVVNIPGTTTDSNQPDPDVAVGGNTGMGTVYYAYRDGDHHPKVVVSNNDGTTWSTPIDIGSFFNIKNAQFPEVIAGDNGRAAVTFIGTTTPSTSSGGQGDIGDDVSDNFGCPSSTAIGCGAVWHLYVAFTYDGGVTWQVVDATPTLPVQRGGVCMNGTGCTGSDRNMLDFNDETIDNQGRVQVAYTDGCTGSCETNPNAAACSVGNQNCTGKFSSVFSMVNQVCGMGLFAHFDPGFNNDPNCASPINTPESPVATLLVFSGTAAAILVGVIATRRRRRQGPLAA